MVNLSQLQNTSSSRVSRGQKFQKDKNYKAKKEFAYRMCARRRTSAMPKPSFLCAPAFSRSMVVMRGGGDVTCFDVMRLLAG